MRTSIPKKIKTSETMIIPTTTQNTRDISTVQTIKTKKIVRREKSGKEENVPIKENVSTLQYHHHTYRSQNRNPFQLRSDLQHIQYQSPTSERMKKLSPNQKSLKYRNPTYVQLTATKTLYIYPTKIPPYTKQLFQSRLKTFYLKKNIFRYFILQLLVKFMQKPFHL